MASLLRQCSSFATRLPGVRQAVRTCSIPVAAPLTSVASSVTSSWRPARAMSTAVLAMPAHAVLGVPSITSPSCPSWRPLPGVQFVRAAPEVQPKRFINLHEYQSKQLMAKYGVRVQNGKMAESQAQAYEIAKELKANADELIVKAQIHAGGRGKGVFNTGYKGGVQICSTPEEVNDAAGAMLGNTLVTKQTGPDGQLTQKVLVHEGISFDRELYFAILMDRSFHGPVIVASKQGGMDIEEVAEKDPHAIYKLPIDIMEGITDAQAKEVASYLDFKPQELTDAAEQIKNLYKLFIGSDATQVEINPLVVATDGKVYCVDAKINFDDSAQFRQKEIFSWRDTSMEDERDVLASQHDLNYIGLDGNIGCMVNGAGLAMATMDIISLHGGTPANFLDVGGGANEKQVEEAFKILQADTRTKALLVNIFGGIMRCDVIATGIVNAAKNIDLSLPLVVRLEGTNVDKGNEILKSSGIDVITADDLDDAAQKAVKAISS